MQKYVVTDIDLDKEFVFYDQYKTKADGSTCKAIDGLELAREKYKELKQHNKEHKLTITRLYPNYHMNTVITDLIESNV